MRQTAGSAQQDQLCNERLVKASGFRAASLPINRKSGALPGKSTRRDEKYCSCPDHAVCHTGLELYAFWQIGTYRAKYVKLLATSTD